MSIKTENILMSSDSALSITNDKNSIDRNLQKVDDAIRSAASKGMTYAVISFSIDNCIHLIREKGYKVEKRPGNFFKAIFDEYLISWSNFDE